MKKYILLLIPAILALWSCSKELSADMAEAASEELIEVSFSATLAETKAELQADGKVFWTTGDAIGVYDGSALRKFILSSGAGTTSAVFSGSISSSATKVEAVYPYSAAYLQGSTLKFSVPSQTITSGHFADPAALVSKTDKVSVGSGLQFRNQVALLKFTVNSAAEIYFVSVPGDNYFGATDDPNHKVTVPAAGTYYAAVVPGTYNGFNVFVDSTVKTGTNALTLVRNEVTDLGNISGGASAALIWDNTQLQSFLKKPIKNGYLMADIDASAGLSGATVSFSQVFDGQGHKLKNWASNGASLFGTSTGKVKNLTLDSSCTLSFPSKLDGVFGFVVRQNKGLVSNVANEASVVRTGLVQADHTANTFLGVIVGESIASSAQILGCSNIAYVTLQIDSFASSKYDFTLGGIVGRLSSDDTVVSGCSNSGSITVTETVGSRQRRHNMGGIVGISEDKAVISDCVNQGAVKFVSAAGKSGACIGGVAGFTLGSLTDCYNTAAVTYQINGGEGQCGYKSVCMGGVAGYCAGPVLRGRNTGAVSISAGYFCGTYAVGVYDNTNATYPAVMLGGVIGAGAPLSASETNFSMTDCYNKGKVSLTVTTPMDGDVSQSSGLRHTIGGLVGDASGPVSGTLAGASYNSGEVSVSLTCDEGTFTHNKDNYTLYVGGIAGANFNNSKGDIAQTNLNITNVENKGNVTVVTQNNHTTNHAVGGIVGWPGKESGCSSITSNCTNSGNVNCSMGGVAARVGGIQGGSGRMVNCTNTGTVGLKSAAGTAAVGGVAGFHSGGYQMTGCTNTGSVTVEPTLASGGAGGLVGVFGNSKMTIGSGCLSDTNIVAPDACPAGIIVGAFNGSDRAITFGPATVKGKVKGVRLTSSNYQDYLHSTRNFDSSVHVFNASFQDDDLGPDPVSFGAYKHVVILGVDGGGAFFKDAYTPRLDEMFRDGATTYRSMTSYPTISAQCWGSMLHSVLPEFHRLTNDIAKKREFDPESPYPSIFRVLHEARPSATMASFVAWNAINIGIVENGLGVYKGNAKDPNLANNIVTYLKSNKPELMFVQFDYGDEAGHEYGYGSTGHLETLSLIDGYIGKIYDQLKANGMLDETLIIVTADHGGTPGGTHGGNTDAERYVFLGARGKTVDRTGPLTEVETRDVAAIAAYALGLEIPDTWTGHIPGGLFRGVAATERNVVELPISENRKHETEPTPALSKVKTLLKDHDVIAYLPFDDSYADAYGKVTTTKSGNLYFYNAYYGTGAAFDDGYVTLKDVTFGKKSFSVSFWLNIGSVDGDPAIISNKNWASGKNDGWVLAAREGFLKFNAGCKSLGERMDLTASMPSDYNQGWMHVILVVDRSANKASIYYDFELEMEEPIPAALQDVAFDALNLNIGQDGTGSMSYHLPAQVDDMIITADVLTATDIAAIKSFYK